MLVLVLVFQPRASLMDFLGLLGTPAAAPRAAKTTKKGVKRNGKSSKVNVKSTCSKTTKKGVTRNGKGAAALRLASACSGMGTEAWALSRLGYEFEHVLACEIKPHMRKFIEAHHKPQHMVHDVTKRDFLKAGPADVMVAGFPCQPFSLAGSREGVDDAKGRGKIILHIAKWIKTHQPRCFLLENVLGLLTMHRETFAEILKILRDIKDPGTGDKAYVVKWARVNSIDCMVPQETGRLHTY